jgi:hypothetical protein
MSLDFNHDLASLRSENRDLKARVYTLEMREKELINSIYSMKATIDALMNEDRSFPAENNIKNDMMRFMLSGL